MATKAYFIGLGGCGLKTVSQLYKKLKSEGVEADYRFTYIDTDEKTKNVLNTEETLIRQNDFVNLGAANPYQLYDQAIHAHDEKSDRMKEWAIPQGERGHLTFPNQSLSDGAQAVRMIGRCAVFYGADAIKTKIRANLAAFQNMHQADDQNTKKVDVWVIASSCGGTGSSLTLDVLYLIDRIVKNDQQLGTPDVKLVLYMPKPFIDRNVGNEQYRMNAFAYMWELNAFRLVQKAGEHDKFAQFAAIPSESTWRDDQPFEMFKYIIPVDTETSLHSLIELEDLYPTVAEMLYYQNKGNLSNSMISNMSNDQRLLSQDLIKHDDTICQWTTPLVAYGYRAVKKANDELRKYLRTRGKLDLLKEGLLGGEVPEDERDEAKKEFASKYILPLLIDADGVTANSRSLKARVQGIFDEIFPLQTEGLEANNVRFKIDEVEGKMESREMRAVREEVFASIKQSINTGVSAEIRMHGLTYTVSLLNLVDDHYLEILCSNTLEPLVKKLEETVKTKKAECEGYLSKLGKKTATPCAAAFDEYRKATAELASAKYAVEIINQLTNYPKGYLEELRKGTNDKVGLNTLIKKVETALGTAKDDYDNLAKEFINSKSNVFTTYIPALEPIARGNDSYWPNDSLFDQFYCNSILDYDREYAARSHGDRVPMHVSETGSNNCISYYLQEIDRNDSLFVDLAQMDKFRLADKFEKEVLNKLDEVLDAAIAKEGSQASRWLSISLESAIDDPEYIPEGMTKSQFINNLGSTSGIHVLYPTTGGSDSAACRYIYAGASQSLAEKLGYSNSPETQFVEDQRMDDRMLIVKMPLGLDFYSYSHFKSIESAYMKNRDEVLKLGEKGGGSSA